MVAGTSSAPTTNTGRVVTDDEDTFTTPRSQMPVGVAE